MNDNNSIYEQIFDYAKMSQEEGDYYLNILRNTCEFTDSPYGNIPNTDAVYMYLIKKEDNEVVFNGALSYGLENRTIDGNIVIKGNKIYVMSHITRLLVEDKCVEYEVSDYFKVLKNKIKRVSYYQFIKKPFVKELLPFSKENMKEFKKSKSMF